MSQISEEDYLQLVDYNRQLSESASSVSDNINNKIVFISSGAIGVTLSSVDFSEIYYHIILFIVAELFFIISLILVVLSLKRSHILHLEMIDIVHNENNISDELIKKVCKVNRQLASLNTTGLIALIIGLSFIAAFYVCNMV